MIDKNHPAYKIYLEYFQKTPEENEDEYESFKSNYDIGVETAKKFLVQFDEYIDDN